MAHKGHCLCGQVTFFIAAQPLAARMCWCTDCQRIASGSATVNVLFPEEAAVYEGELTTIRLTVDSGNVVERGFCPKCGSQMFSRTINPPDLPIRVRAGTLDNPELIAPQAIIWADSAPDWVVFDPKLPRHSRGPESPVIYKI